MIDVLMKFGTEIIFIRVNGHNVLFASSTERNKMTSIDGLRLSYDGVIKEFPELKDNPNWRIEAIAKFKDKLKSLENEDAVTNFIVNDLSKFGYVPFKKMKIGHRPELI